MKKLFIITRRDLPLGDQAVQCSHAVELWKYWNPGDCQVHTKVLLVVHDEKRLMAIANKLKKIYEVDFWLFHEPDLNDELTSLACLTDNYGMFQGFKKVGE